MKKTSAYLIALAVVLGFAVGGPAAAQSTKPWRHGLIQPKSDAGILLTAAQTDFLKQLGRDLEISAGANINVIPKSGGNNLKGSVQWSATGKGYWNHFTGDNITDELRAQFPERTMLRAVDDAGVMRLVPY